MAERLALVQLAQPVVVVAVLTTLQHREVREILQAQAVVEILVEAVEVAVVLVLVRIRVVEVVAQVLLVLDPQGPNPQLAPVFLVKVIPAVEVDTVVAIVLEMVVVAYLVLLLDSVKSEQVAAVAEIIPAHLDGEDLAVEPTEAPVAA